MFDPEREKPSPDYLLRAMAIMKSMDAGISLISELSRATALPATTIVRTAAIMADERLIEASLVGDDVKLSMVRRGPSPRNGN
ncbi:hypothetical protein [Sphingopyxis sp.]|uniref:hypothetical protein n=1 Tax=Sphingopyxis sp. TaxID=1908224 RepID=UPI002D76C490|nr:hypothetical protein [Sphingopyxis sp.]HET6526844.1 hypothetical protein [Sphingopyxis sp.]